MLLFSKHSSTIFAVPKFKSELRLLVGLERIKHRIKHDYNEKNHLVTTIADAAQHMAGKRFF